MIALVKDYDLLDANALIGRVAQPAPMTFHTRAELLAELDYYRIQEAVVTHAAARDYYPSYSNALLEIELKGERRLHGCWVQPVHPDPDGQPIEQTVK